MSTSNTIQGQRPNRPGSSQYFASWEIPTEEAGAGFMDRVERFERFVRRAGLFALWRKAYRFLYNMDDEGFTGYEVGRKGEQGELAVAKFNHIRSLRTSYLSLATSTLGNMEPQAVNDDYQSELECRMAKGVLQYYEDSMGFEQIRIEAIENAVDMGQGGYCELWDPSKGRVLVPPMPPLQAAIAGAPTGALKPNENPPEGHPGQAAVTEIASPTPTAPIFEGDLDAFSTTPIDTIVDPRARTHKTDWVILRRYLNKFDVAAKYAHGDDDLYQRIINQSRKPTGHDTFYNLDLAMQLFYSPWDEETDEIPCFYLIHKSTPAVPGGRFAVFLAANLVLIDQSLELAGARFQRIQPSPIRDTPWGYTPVFDLLAPQETIDCMSSIRVTNQKTFGVQSLVAPKGSDLNAEQIASGCVLFEYNPGLPEPHPLQLTSTAPEIIKCRETDIEEMGTLIGVNSVVRGDPEASLKSGSALALVQAQAVQFSSAFQRSIADFTGAIGTDRLEILKAHLDPAREFLILGADMSLEVMTVSRGNISSVKRVIVKSGNPLAATISGRVTMAEMLIQIPGVVENPRQLLRLLESGRMEPITKRPERELSNIQRENELMLKGIGAPPPMPPPIPDGTPPNIAAVMNRAQQAQTQQHPFFRPDGQYVRSLTTDNHRLHAQEHLTVLMSPQARNNPQIVQAVLGHIAQHQQMLAMLTQQNPGLLEMTGQQPLMSALPPPAPGAPPPGGPHPGPGGPAPGPHPPGGGAPPQMGPKLAHPSKGGPAPGGGGGSQLPAFPKNDATGDRWTPPPSPAAQ